MRRESQPSRIAPETGPIHVPARHIGGQGSVFIRVQQPAEDRSLRLGSAALPAFGERRPQPLQQGRAPHEKIESRPQRTGLDRLHQPPEIQRALQGIAAVRKGLGQTGIRLDPGQQLRLGWPA